MTQTTRRHLLPLGVVIALTPALLTVAPRKAQANTRTEIDGEVASALRTLRAQENTRPLFAQAKSILIFPRLFLHRTRLIFSTTIRRPAPLRHLSP